MDTITYIGEHLLPGQIGHTAVIIALVSALFTCFSYFQSNQTRNIDHKESFSWKILGKLGFLVHGISVFTIIITTFYILINKHYEYSYAQAHVSDDLAFQYIFSAFWEGQEGSFLLWMFWNILLGFVLMMRSKQFEAPVLFTISLLQLILTTMILGIYVGEETKIGSSIFTLLREVMAAPVFQKADYVELLEGSGLNPLLQNYWMTIHPPTLFLGFASTVVPFAFAIAGLWNNEHKEWLTPAFKWGLFSAFFLGTGILMGSAWAYEALSFGGYWAWDPVENTSFVPWVILVGAIHANLVAKKTGYSIRASYIFYFLSFILVIYSTVLTRSGWLGDTSVHAFTELGLETQLVILLATFILFPFGLFIYRFKNIPNPKKEESISSKEFWMFVGTVVFLFSSILILYSTSLPLINKIVKYFDEDYIGRAISDPIEHYNRYQIWVAILIGILSGFAQLLRYREKNGNSYLKKMAKPFGVIFAISLLFTFLINLWIQNPTWQHHLLLFASTFTIISNLYFIFSLDKEKLNSLAGVVAHIGFAVMMIGIMSSGLNKKYISSNPQAQRNLLPDNLLGTNALLFENSPLFLQGYEVTYLKDTLRGNMRDFLISYKEIDIESSEVIDSFVLTPNIQYDNKFTNVAAYNPSTKRYWNKDIFTHINLPPSKTNIESAQAEEDSLNYKSYQIPINETLTILDTTRDEFGETIKKLNFNIAGLNMPPKSKEYTPQDGDIAIGVDVAVQGANKKKKHNEEAIVIVRDGMVFHKNASIPNLAMKIKLNEKILDDILTPDDKIKYQQIRMKSGQEANINGYVITFDGFNKKPNHKDLKLEPNDIAVSAKLRITSPEGRINLLEPVYLIRNNQSFNLKDFKITEGIHTKLKTILPEKGEVVLEIGVTPKPNTVLLEVATNAYRNDYIILEAIELPGINLFWIGSVLMLIGFLIGLVLRMIKKRNESYAWR